MMKLKLAKRPPAADRELQAALRQEKRLEQAALKARPAAWKTGLQQKIPPKVLDGLQAAFGKAFALVFNQGRGLLEKSYSREELLAVHAVRDRDAREGGREGLRRMDMGAKQSGLFNMAVTAVEGVALGAVGVGMPDVVLFISTLLKGIYETALSYGYDYQPRGEQMLILKMMEASLAVGEERQRLNAQADAWMMNADAPVTDEEFRAQMQRTADAFAADMLLLKFVQGIPVVGVLGGAANPGYYRRVMKYVQLKYRKRYLMKLKQGGV